MCEIKKKDGVEASKRRRRLYELEDYICSIVGTCLSDCELQKLGKKAEFEVRQGMSSYEVHVLLVQEAGRL